MPETLTLQINGSTRTVDTEPERSLLSVLRDDLDLTGCKYGCGEGQCGACTVLVDGTPTRSCVTQVGQVSGKQIKTIEGLASGNSLHPVQQAFLDCDALQCGYCTPGMILSTVGLLAQHPAPTRDDIVQYMNGNICRCGTYPRIIKAIEQAAHRQKGGAR